MSTTSASVLGLKKSFGFGDRLGNATPGHLRSVLKHDFAPIFAQQSIREMTRTNRTPEGVMAAAVDALIAAGYDGVWGADADHLKTQEDVQRTAQAGFRFFTIDPSEYVVNAADTMDEATLRAEVAKQVEDGIFDNAGWTSLYLGKSFELNGGESLQFSEEPLLRAAVKYARAIAYAATMAGYIADANKGRDYEIEVSVDETDSPTSALEHLFFAAELKRRNVSVISLAPRFIGEFEKGIDYKGDHALFEKALVQHTAIARTFGPYKISVHSGSDKFSVYPIIGRVCGDLLHVKTAGTSYLEALRVLVRVNPNTFREVIDYSLGRFEIDRHSYHISTSLSDLDAVKSCGNADLEHLGLDENYGRQLLHVTFGSVLTQGKDKNGRPFYDSLMEALDSHAELHAELLEKHFNKHLDALNAG